jgi:hypothetical protein
MGFPVTAPTREQSASVPPVLTDAECDAMIDTLPIAQDGFDIGIVDLWRGMVRAGYAAAQRAVPREIYVGLHSALKLAEEYLTPVGSKNEINPEDALVYVQSAISQFETNYAAPQHREGT